MNLARLLCRRKQDHAPRRGERERRDRHTRIGRRLERTTVYVTASALRVAHELIDDGHRSRYLVRAKRGSSRPSTHVRPGPKREPSHNKLRAARVESRYVI